MFLRRLKTILFGDIIEKNVCNKSNIMGAVGCNVRSSSSESSVDLLEKWKKKFEHENVPEVDSSLRNILAHIFKNKNNLNSDVSSTTSLRTLEDLQTKSITLTEDEVFRFEQLCECRVARMPIQYILGEWDFRDLTLKMEPPVFIPRPETEELVELILQQFDVKQPVRFLEIGCGSGAISLALLKSLPNSIGTAIDQSQRACELATKNAKSQDFQNRIRVFMHKLTNESNLDDFDGSLDLIVSNPPYVPRNDLIHVQPEIKLYEDLRALDGGVDGLEVIKSIFLIASKKLSKQGLLWLEVDPSHPPLIQNYLQDHISSLQLKYVACYKDVYQKDRFVEIIKL